MAYPVDPVEVVDLLLLVKAVLAILGVLLFVYYKMHYEQAKKHMQVHLFYAKWRAARHLTAMGAAVAGFAIGFSVELFGVLYGAQHGFSANHARFYSSLFEAGSLLAMLYVFFELSLEDVPHFQHMAEASRHRAHHNHGGQAAKNEPQFRHAEGQRRRKAGKRKKRK